MATAKITTKEVTKEVTSYEQRVVLELTADEASALRCVVINTGGSLYRSRRKHTDAISNALRLAGVHEGVDDVGQALWFRNSF